MPSSFRRLIPVIFAVLIFCLAGCGGGGGSDSSESGGSGNNAIVATDLSGVAAAGSPLVGDVYLKDSLGVLVGPKAIDEDGGFFFSAGEISHLTPPFFLEAKGRAGAEGFTLYSFAGGPGTANINPLTNLAIGMAAGSDPARAYTSTALNAAALQTAVRQIRASLQNLLALFNAGNQDFFSGAYAADHTGLDAMFDVVRITVTRSARAIITDKTSNASLMNAALGEVAGKFLRAGDVADLAGTEADMLGIAALFERFAAAMNQRATAPEALDPLIDAAPDGPFPFGINNGFLRPNYLNYLLYLSDNMAAAGTTIERICFNIMGREPDGAYNLTSIWVFSDGTASLNGTGLSQLPDRVVKVGNEWKFTGNYSFATSVSLQLGATKKIGPSNDLTYHSFFILNVIDYIGWIDHAVFTVEGIPGEYSETTSSQNPKEILAGYYIGNEETAGIENVISANGKADLSFLLYGADGQLIQTGSIPIYKAPPPTDTIDDQRALDPFFAWVGTVFNSHSLDDLQPLFSSGGTYEFSYITPSTAVSSVIKAGSSLVAWDLGSNSATFTAPILTRSGGTARGSIPVSSLNFSPSGAKLKVFTTDIYGREFWVAWEYE